MTTSNDAGPDAGTLHRRSKSLLPGYGVPDSVTDAVAGFLGDLFTRGTLTFRDRQLITLAVLVALGTHDPLKLHVRNALASGLTKDEIYEAILQVGAYAGMGRSTDAYAVTQDILAPKGTDAAG